METSPNRISLQTVNTGRSKLLPVYATKSYFGDNSAQTGIGFALPGSGKKGKTLPGLSKGERFASMSQKEKAYSGMEKPTSSKTALHASDCRYSRKASAASSFLVMFNTAAG